MYKRDKKKADLFLGEHRTQFETENKRQRDFLYAKRDKREKEERFCRKLPWDVCRHPLEVILESNQRENCVGSSGRNSNSHFTKFSFILAMIG